MQIQHMWFGPKKKSKKKEQNQSSFSWLLSRTEPGLNVSLAAGEASLFPRWCSPVSTSTSRREGASASMSWTSVFNNPSTLTPLSPFDLPLVFCMIFFGTCTRTHRAPDGQSTSQRAPQKKKITRCHSRTRTRTTQRRERYDNPVSGSAIWAQPCTRSMLLERNGIQFSSWISTSWLLSLASFIASRAYSWSENGIHPTKVLLNSYSSVVSKAWARYEL